MVFCEVDYPEDVPDDFDSCDQVICECPEEHEVGYDDDPQLHGVEGDDVEVEGCEDDE